MGRINFEMWQQSRGGPFVVMGSAKCVKWRGDEGLSITNGVPHIGNDYTRAARFRAHEGILSDADGEVLVFFSEGLCAGLWNNHENYGAISWELSGIASSGEIPQFEQKDLKNKIFLFDFYISEDQISIVSSEKVGIKSNYSSINVRTGWHVLVRYTLEFGNVEKYGRYVVYKFERR